MEYQSVNHDIETEYNYDSEKFKKDIIVDISEKKQNIIKPNKKCNDILILE
jgi:chloramphenicol O-acetyltransferase